MSSGIIANAADAGQKTLIGATTAIGFSEWLTANASSVNAIAMVITALGALWFGRINAKTNRMRADAEIEANNIASGKIKEECLDSMIGAVLDLDIDSEIKEQIQSTLKDK